MDEINEAFVKEFTTNKYGIPVVKCCASCKHHLSEGVERKRICKLSGKKHDLEYFCGSSWKMSEKLDNAGKGGGKVKKLAYLQHIIEHGKITSEDWEREHGSRYLTKR